MGLKLGQAFGWVRRPRAGTEAGASLVEYALLVALIAVVALVTVMLAGQEVSSTFNEVGNSLNSG